MLIVLVALIVNTGEYEDVQNEQTAADGYRHAEGSGVSGEAVLGCSRRLLEGQLARLGRCDVGRPFARRLEGSWPRRCRR